MDKKTVLVTGVGGNVAQGIIRNIRASEFPIKVVGTNIAHFSAGNHLCDAFYKVPYGIEPEYIDAINQIVASEQVDLIIPSTDSEVYELSLHRERLLCPVVASGHETAGFCLDKYKTYGRFHKHNVPFATSFLPSEYQGQFDQIIVKPRKGGGSRGIALNPTDLSKFEDNEYMVQELLSGQEITTSFYVNRAGNMHSCITMERILEHGTSTHCKVVSTYDSEVTKLLEAMMQVGDFMGSINVQSMVTEDGTIIPFEINCRISGTNSIRANFGFKDIEYVLAEWLYDMPAAETTIRYGIATRVLMDVIYTEAKDFTEAKDGSSRHYLY
ncbi:MAG: ATP-grasp domain-containing protein [Bacteroidota bacterium]